MKRKVYVELEFDDMNEEGWDESCIAEYLERPNRIIGGSLTVWSDFKPMLQDWLDIPIKEEKKIGYISTRHFSEQDLKDGICIAETEYCVSESPDGDYGSFSTLMGAVEYARQTFDAIQFVGGS
jgi:hypothetical protein